MGLGPRRSLKTTFQAVRDALSDAGVFDDDYRGFELWSGGQPAPAGASSPIEHGGYIVPGKGHASYGACLRCSPTVRRTAAGRHDHPSSTKSNITDIQSVGKFAPQIDTGGR